MHQLKNDLKIKAFCSIKNNTVSHNSNIIVKKESALLFNDFSKQVYKEHINNYPKFFKMDAASKLAFLTAEFLLNNTDISPEEKENTAIVLSNQSASLDTDRKHQETINDTDNYFPSPAIFVYTLPNIGIGEISIRHKLYGENAFFVFDTFNAKTLLQYSTCLIDANKANNIICGWVNVDNNDYEAFMYIVSKEGDYEHTIKNINELYKS
jgi:hypothetical protein